MPVPSAMISGRIFSLESTLSRRAFSTFSILPHRGRIAWNRRSRPCLAEPPAESPSTMYSSLRSGSRSWQSASLPGRADALQRALADDEVARLARRLPGARGGQRLLDDAPAVARVLLEVLREPLGDGGLDLALHLRVAELRLGLALELRIGAA